MIFKNLSLILITAPRWQLWILTLLMLGALPVVWYRAWYAPRKAACQERERLVHALSSMGMPADEPRFGEQPTPDYLCRAIIRSAGEEGVVLEKIGVSTPRVEPFALCVAFSGPYENLAELIARIEEMPLLWLSFAMSETSLSGTLTPRV